MDEIENSHEENDFDVGRVDDFFIFYKKWGLLKMKVNVIVRIETTGA